MPARSCSPRRTLALVLGTPSRLRSLVGHEHGRTIPVADTGKSQGSADLLVGDGVELLSQQCWVSDELLSQQCWVTERSGFSDWGRLIWSAGKWRHRKCFIPSRDKRSQGTGGD